MIRTALGDRSKTLFFGKATIAKLAEELSGTNCQFLGKILKISRDRIRSKTENPLDFVVGYSEDHTV